ncbi:MAG: hypothetical protein EP297_05615 [Gammaproteobacteria bacterium]|nr:MAG: hypothetical protein EP297_05615 [Gammaproteobacteria bacterium]
MTKADIMKRLKSARVSHLIWRSYAQALISGMAIDKEKVPVAHTDCDFGHWYYGDGQILSSLPSFQAIESPHKNLHSEYMHICIGLFGDECPVGEKNIDKLGLKHTPNSNDVNNQHIRKIIDASSALLTAIEELETDIKKREDSDLESL